MSPTRTQKRSAGVVTLVGAGPGDERLLTLRGAQALAAADVVVVDRAALEPFLVHCREGVEVVDVPEADAGDRAKALVAAAKEGRRTVGLVSGDPSAFGALAEEGADLAKAKLTFEVVPGVHPAFAVPMHAGVPLSSTKAHDVTVVDLAGDLEPDWSRLAGASTLVLLDALGSLGKAAAALTEQGRTGGTPVLVTERGTTTRQRTVVSTLDTVEADVAAAGLESTAVAVVGDVVKLRDKLSWFETKPLFGWKVLVPRTKEQSGALCEQLRSYGAVPVEVPTIAVEPPRTPAQMDRAINGLVSGRYQWVGFTSANAVRAVREKFEELGLDARSMGGVKVAVVGDATARALLDWGIRPELVPPPGQQSGEGLLEVWPAYDDVYDHLDRVFLPRADIATETLSAGLKELGWQVDDVTAYRTVRAAPPPAETREAIKTGGFDAVLFTSSSTVRNLVGIAGKPHPSTVIAVIGPQTAQTADEHGLRVDVTAPTTSASALAAALAGYGRERRATDDEPPGKANRRKKSR